MKKLILLMLVFILLGCEKKEYSLEEERKKTILQCCECKILDFKGNLCNGAEYEYDYPVKGISESNLEFYQRTVLMNVKSYYKLAKECYNYDSYISSRIIIVIKFIQYLFAFFYSCL